MRRLSFDRLRAEFFPPPDTFDRQRGVETSGLKSMFFQRFLLGKKSQCYRYQGVDEDRFTEAVKDLPRWTFIDLGCGKGKPLILAREAGFPRVMGVEFDSGLCRIARRNLRRLKISGDILCQDARQFVPPSEPFILFAYNPFGPEVLASVLAKVRGREAIALYMQPVHGDLFREFKPLRVHEHFCTYSLQLVS